MNKLQQILAFLKKLKAPTKTVSTGFTLTCNKCGAENVDIYTESFVIDAVAKETNAEWAKPFFAGQDVVWVLIKCLKCGEAKEDCKPSTGMYG